MDKLFTDIDSILREYYLEILAEPIEGPLIKARKSKIVQEILLEIVPEIFFMKMQEYLKSNADKEFNSDKEDNSRIRMGLAALFVQYFGHRCRGIKNPSSYVFAEWEEWFGENKKLPQRRKYMKS